MMGHIWRRKDGATLAAKGSPENIFPLCSLTAEERAAAEASQRRLADMGCRVLAVAVCRSMEEIPENLSSCRLELVGLTAFIDPPRAAVPASIAACRSAGISYSRFIEGLKAANIGLDRKVLSDIAIRDEAAFGAIVAQVRAALETKSAAKA